ncbi:mitochondrial outer membrane protein porin 2-like isoform X2 [Glycine soja]|uniref:mitochondrial outer membrane protein porin 2 isoform X2 n=1 Tax=Glycine max TaxID=3847 RepID=UPI0003DE9351|nr:mitochondrial outer membrane protein porin 2 isoform X2 [Glycine max]XP_028198622.1 mitochondrial outer membrane protein porin 2-like isoform X2 [Glycine soja]|eukprot:XP_006607010.1 mitochondrial outer membrane protein porin 2 isoform X2 [Glycine max]
MEKGLYKPLFGCWCFCAAAKMSGKGPGFFSEIGKRGRDILTKDYNSDQRFTISSSTNSGLDLKSTLVKSRGLSSGDVAAEFKYKNKAVNVKVDTESNVLTTFTVSDVVPSAKTIASIRLPDYSSGKVEVQYLHEHVAFTLGVGLDRSPVIDFSGTMGTPSIAFGAETSYSTSVGKFMKYNAGLCLKMPSSNASVIFIVFGAQTSFSTSIGKFTKYKVGLCSKKPSSNASVILGDKGDSMKVSYLHQLERLNGGVVVGEISRRFSTNENTLTVGCSYVVDSQTVLKAKLNNHGNLGALLQHELTRTIINISKLLEAVCAD